MMRNIWAGFWYVEIRKFKINMPHTQKISRKIYTFMRKRSTNGDFFSLVSVTKCEDK